MENDLKVVAEEIRALIISTLSKTGGHLASNLGVVELSIALHYAFDTPRDKIVWDVGHQSYPHKILTGRREQFHTIRQPGGISGYCKREESPYDAFGAGHSSTSISAALGLAAVMRVAAGETSYEAGLRAAVRLCGKGSRPDAVFCQNDVLAMGLIDGLRGEFGLDVPGDMAVVGFDDIPAASQRPYRLTTVRQPTAAMMEATADLLARHLSGEAERIDALLLPSLLVERDTVRGR